MWQHRKGPRKDDDPIPDWVADAIQFFIQILPVLPGRKFFFGKKKIRRRPIVLYTDAMYDPNKTPAGMVGIVIYDPEDLASKWRYASAAVPQELIDKFRKRKQYVGQLEVLAAVAAFRRGHAGMLRSGRTAGTAGGCVAVRWHAAPRGGKA